MTRVQIITQLLERFPELVDPMQSGNGDGDTGLRLMPSTYTPTVREIERLLHVMREDRTRSLVALPSGEKVSVRSLWWHVTERYLRCRNVTKDVPVTRRAKGRRTVTVMERRAIVQHNPAVKQDRVDRAIQWIAAEWTLAGEPFVPRELVAA